MIDMVERLRVWVNIIDNGDYPMPDAVVANMMREAADEIERLRADKRRLDYLDTLAQRLNERYGTHYGWDLVLTHNVTRLMLQGGGGDGHVSAIDLHDSKGGHGAMSSCRDAIDKSMDKTSRSTEPTIRTNNPEFPEGSPPWECPINDPTCTKNCGSYGCGN